MGPRPSCHEDSTSGSLFQLPDSLLTREQVDQQNKFLKGLQNFPWSEAGEAPSRSESNLILETILYKVLHQLRSRTLSYKVLVEAINNGDKDKVFATLAHNIAFFDGTDNYAYCHTFLKKSYRNDYSMEKLEPSATIPAIVAKYQQEAEKKTKKVEEKSEGDMELVEHVIDNLNAEMEEMETPAVEIHSGRNDEQEHALRMERIKNEFLENMSIQNQKTQRKIQDLRHERRMIEEENDIRMHGSHTRRVNIQKILLKYPVVIFSTRLEIENANSFKEILLRKSIEFHHVEVDDDVEVRLAIKEYTENEVFPKVFINGKLVEVDELEEFINDY